MDPELKETLLGMLNELEFNRLTVVLGEAQWPQFTGHKVRVAIEVNADWYRLFCAGYPSERNNRRGKFDTRVRRKDTIRVLRKLANEKKTSSKYAKPILDIARTLKYKWCASVNQDYQESENWDEET